MKKGYLLAILAIVVAFVFFFIISQLIFYPFERRELNWVAETELLIARQAVSNVEQFAKFLESELKYAASLEEVQRIDPVLCPLRLEELSIRINLPGLSFSRMDENGIIRFAYPQRHIRDVSVREQPHVQYTLRTKKETVSNPIRAVQGFDAVIFHMPVFTRDSVYKGSVAALVPTNFFPKLIVEKIKLTKDSYVWMLADDGTILFHPLLEVGKKAWDVISKDDAGLREVIERQLQGEEGTGIYRFGGVKKIVGFAPVKLPGRMWVVAVAAPYDEVLKGIGGVRIRILFISLFLFLFVVSLFLFYRRSTLKHALASRELIELKQINRLYSDMLENIDYGIFIVDESLTILSANLSFGKIFELTYEPEGKVVFEVLPFLKDYGYDRFYREGFRRGVFIKDAREFMYNGVVKFLEFKLIPIYEEDGKVGRILTLIRDISEEKKLERELTEKSNNLERTNRILQELSITDELTGIYNYRFFKESVTSLFKWAKEKGKTFSICVMDLDRFKEINDTLGHLEGDKILAAVAELAKSLVPPPGSIARYGGDEFVLILQDRTKEEALEIAESIREAIERNFTSKRTSSISLTVSVGVAEFSRFLNGIDDLIRQADRALYKAKLTGRNLVVAFSE